MDDNLDFGFQDIMEFVAEHGAAGGTYRIGRREEGKRDASVRR